MQHTECKCTQCTHVIHRKLTWLSQTHRTAEVGRALWPNLCSSRATQSRVLGPMARWLLKIFKVDMPQFLGSLCTFLLVLSLGNADILHMYADNASTLHIKVQYKKIDLPSHATQIFVLPTSFLSKFASHYKVKKNSLNWKSIFSLLRVCSMCLYMLKNNLLMSYKNILILYL